MPTADLDIVWTAIALHTTPGIPEFMHPVVKSVPRTSTFKKDIIQAFYDGIRHKPDTTFGNVKADVIADKQPHFHRGNFCSVIRGSRWAG